MVGGLGHLGWVYRALTRHAAVLGKCIDVTATRCVMTLQTPRAMAVLGGARTNAVRPRAQRAFGTSLSLCGEKTVSVRCVRSVPRVPL